MAMINRQISEFSAQAYHADDFCTITRSDVIGHWSVFFFYPADFSFVCPTELGDLADNYSTFKELGCEIYSISCDTHFVHKAWHTNSPNVSKINYYMMADPSGELARMFGIFNEETGLAERGAYIINPEGTIVSEEIIASNVGRSSEELLRKLQALQFVHEHGDEVCPAKWKPGAKTIRPGADLVNIL